MLISAANQTNSEILYKTYSYSNGKMEENVVYKKDCAYVAFDKVEISKDSPEYENICSQMHLADTYGVTALSNTLFYEANEIMYDYYDGKLAKEDVKQFFKDYLYHSVGEVEENNAGQQKSVTAYVSTIYVFFSIFMQNSSHSFSSLLLDKHNWNDTVSKESYIKVSDILKNFHMEHYRNNRFEFFWMGNEN